MQKSTYTKVASYEGKKGEVKKVVLLYSGGLDTSTMLKWIQDEYKAEVIAVTIDVGQQTDDLEQARKKALKLGAIKAVVIDAKDEFANEYLSRAIKANLQYQGTYHVSTISRYLFAKIVIKIAAEEGADAIAHGCTGKGTDQIRIEGAALAYNPDIKILAPVREWNMGRTEQLEYCKEHGIPVKQTSEKPYSYDDNMWGVTAEGGEIENPALIPPLEKILQITKPPEKAKDTPEYIQIEFVKGVPVAVDGKAKSLKDIIIELNKRAGEHAVGIVHSIEDRVIGLKIRGVYEAPAAETLITAHKALERYTSTMRENKFKTLIDEEWAYLTYGALWNEPLMENLNAYIDTANEKVTGIVTVKLYKGHVEAVALETPNTIFDEKLATFMETSNAFNINASAGFIEHYTSQMVRAQQREHTALLSIGKRSNKTKLLPSIKKLFNMKYKLYATYKTHKFLTKNGIESILVNKVSQPHLKPNLAELLDANRFDLIINIPMERQITQTDGKVIRQKAVKHNVKLITSVNVAQDFINQLQAARV
jgi:argininosuccinate synthase